MEKQFDEVQNVYLDFIKNTNLSHGSVSAVKGNETIVYTTDRQVFERVSIYEKLKRAEYVKEHGEEGAYSVGTYKLHVGTYRDGYADFKQDARCAMLYREGKAEKFESPEHATLILTDSLEAQAEYIDIVRDAHCEHYNISLDRGFPETETAYIKVSGAYEDQIMDPIWAHNRGDLTMLNAKLTALGLEENFHPVEPATEQ